MKLQTRAIAKTVEFFHTMGMDTKLSDYTKTMIKPLILLLIVLTKEVGKV
jgi:alcohol dehydrogenase YqhD (iron-dependent ADH family)